MCLDNKSPPGPGTDWDRQEVYSFRVTMATSLWPHTGGGTWSGGALSAMGQKVCKFLFANWVILSIKKPHSAVQNKQLPNPQLFFFIVN